MEPEFLLVNLRVDFNNDCSADEIKKTIAAMDTAMKRAYPVIKKVFVEVESRSRRT
jgi:hypothetical protein